MIKAFIGWIKSLFAEEYEVTLWFRIDKEERVFTHKEEHRLKRLHKINNKELRGVTVDGQPITVKSTIGFDYRITKIK